MGNHQLCTPTVNLLLGIVWRLEARAQHAGETKKLKIKLSQKLRCGGIVSSNIRATSGFMSGRF